MPEDHVFKLKTPSLTPPPERPRGEKAIESTPEPESKPTGESLDRPHSASYFNVPGWGDLLLNPSLDALGIKDKIVFIESNLNSQLAKSGMKTDTESFNKILSEMEKYLQLDKELHEPFYRVNRVYTMLKTIEKAKIESEERKKYLESILNR